MQQSLTVSGSCSLVTTSQHLSVITSQHLSLRTSQHLSVTTSQHLSVTTSVPVFMPEVEPCIHYCKALHDPFPELFTLET